MTSLVNERKKRGSVLQNGHSAFHQSCRNAALPLSPDFFAALKDGSRYAILYRVGAVDKPQTRTRKIADFVAMLERGETIRS